MRPIFSAFALLAALGCTDATTAPSAVVPEAPVDSDADFRHRLLEIAANYKAYGMADDRMREAAIPCAAVAVPKSDHRFSRSSDEGTHGKKLYLMFAANLDPVMHSYTGDRQRKSGDQVIVKESWMAVEDERTSPSVRGEDGKHYTAGAKGPLFVMFQIDARDPRADAGWIYGTTAPDGKTITGIGRLANCMGCHEKAPHGRLFGLPND